MGREQSTGKPTNGEIWEKRGNYQRKKFEGSRKTRKDKGKPRKTKKDKEGQRRRPRLYLSANQGIVLPFPVSEIQQ